MSEEKDHWYEAYFLGIGTGFFLSIILFGSIGLYFR